MDWYRKCSYGLIGIKRSNSYNRIKLYALNEILILYCCHSFAMLDTNKIIYSNLNSKIFASSMTLEI